MMYHTCLLGEQIALANEGVTPGAEETEKMCFLEEDSNTDFGLANCCTVYVCQRKELFKTLNAPPEGQGILGFGCIRKPEGIGTVVFLITDSEGIEREIELDNVLYIPDAPKNLISISKWSREQNDNCRVFSRGTYFIFLWEKDKHQKLVLYPIHCRIPLMRVNEGALQHYRKFIDQCSTC